MCHTTQLGGNQAMTCPDGIQVMAHNVAGYDVNRSDVNKMEVKKQDDWAECLLATTNMLPPPAAKPLAIADVSANYPIQAQVNAIMENTPSLLAKGNAKVKNNPFEYVRRGDNKRPTAMNSLTLTEHLWGIFAMIHDPMVPRNYKPALLRHIEEIVEDSRDYDWAMAVRRWSEEVFSLVAENRLPDGWLATGRIQLLWTLIAHASTAKITAQKDVKPLQFHSGQYNNNNDQWKGWPPCPAYNSAEGCSHASGHVVNGKRLQHVCSHCFVTNAVTYPHAEVNCRNKNPSKNHHF